MVGLLGGLIFVGLEMKQSQLIALAAQQQARVDTLQILLTLLQKRLATGNYSPWRAGESK